MGRQIKQNAFLFFSSKHFWSPKINTVGKCSYKRTNTEFNLNSFTNVFKQKKRYDKTTQET